MRHEGILGRILVATWAFFFVIVLLLLFTPKLLARIPHLEMIRPFFILLGLASIAYGVAWIYRQGMKRARKRSRDRRTSNQKMLSDLLEVTRYPTDRENCVRI